MKIRTPAWALPKTVKSLLLTMKKLSLVILSGNKISLKSVDYSISLSIFMYIGKDGM